MTTIVVYRYDDPVGGEYGLGRRENPVSEPR